MRDLLLHIDGYPAPTSTLASEQAIALAASLRAQLSALAIAAEFDPSHLAGVLGLRDAIAEERKRSADACELALAHFASCAHAAPSSGTVAGRSASPWCDDCHFSNSST